MEMGGVGEGGRCGWRSVGVVLVLCMGVADGELVWLQEDAGGCGYE